VTNTAYRFTPERYEVELEALLRELVTLDRFDQDRYERILRRHPKEGSGFFSKSEIIQGFRHLNKKLHWGLSEREFSEKLRMKPVRTLSGVAPVTVLTKPYPCPGRCIFCPSDVRMPKSYLSDEPGAQRAAQHQFDPYRQSFSRLVSYHNTGHQVDKVELIILGGTWSSYPEAYQIWFVKRCFDALNDFDPATVESGPGSNDRPDVDFRHLEERIDGRRITRSYNRIIKDFLARQPSSAGVQDAATWSALADTQSRNESAACRCVGLVLETRPDHLTLDEVIRIRRLGATKVQIGYQSLSDEVLKLNHREHDVATTRKATRLLREAGLKIHAHWMPNLYGSSPQLDIEDFERLFDDPDFRPDELKIYPCSLIESAELMAYYRAGQWRPYEHDELLHVLTECLLRTPEYCRVTRVIRDIPGPDIVTGNKVTNLREVAEASLKRRKKKCRDIRSREIRNRRIDPRTLTLRRLDYESNVGLEIFLQYVTPENRLAAFLRLSLPDRPILIQEIGTSAVIREVHVYGLVAGIGQRRGVRSQHLGLGTSLIESAARIASDAGFDDLAVISAVGTRPYYRKLRFKDGDLYQHRDLTSGRPRQ
jgi:elongator complex protein 3